MEEWCRRNKFRASSIGNWVPFFYDKRRFFNYKHWTDLHKIAKFLNPKVGAWTLVITGREKHDWGFMTDKGFKSHKELGVGDLGAKLGSEPD